MRLMMPTSIKNNKRHEQKIIFFLLNALPPLHPPFDVSQLTSCCSL